MRMFIGITTAAVLLATMGGVSRADHYRQRGHSDRGYCESGRCYEPTRTYERCYEPTYEPYCEEESTWEDCERSEYGRGYERKFERRDFERHDRDRRDFDKRGRSRDRRP